MDKTTTVVGTCAHVTVTIEAYPWETEKQATLRCARKLEKRLKDSGGWPDYLKSINAGN